MINLDEHVSLPSGQLMVLILNMEIRRLAIMQSASSNLALGHPTKHRGKSMTS
jgi:hypothetical protein